MTTRLLAVALLLIVARLLYWKRPTPPGEFSLAWVHTGDTQDNIRVVPPLKRAG